MARNDRRPATLAFAVWLSASASLYAHDTPLFDGRTLSGWMQSGGQPVQPGWEVVDGAIHLQAGMRPGDIVTEREYGDFDLQFEWKIAKGGNSGVKYRVRKYDGRTLGCEYQIIDDQDYGSDSKQSAGSLYALYEPDSTKYLNPPGEYNRSRIVVIGNHIEHWLNGRQVLTAEAGSPDWFARIADSKFADVEGFGLNRLGRIMLTDHGSEVWYRNFVLKELVAAPETTVYCPPAVVRCTPICSVRPACSPRRFLGRRISFRRR